MGFKVNYRGLEVTCETPEDVDALASLARIGKACKQAVRGFPKPSLFDNPKHGSARILVRELAEQPRNLLRLLAEKGKMTDAEIRELLGLQNNKALAGVLTGISKRAKKAGINKAIVEKVSKRNGTGERRYLYSIGSQFLEEVRNGLAVQTA
jgi:hypothetical protein